MVKYTREEYKKHIFNLENGWADNKYNRKFKEVTWEIAMEYVDRLIKELDISEPVILPCGPNDIDLDWETKGKFDLLINIPGDLSEGIDYYGSSGANEVKGVKEDFKTTISKIVNWYRKIKKIKG